jgi:hypothetical protein
MSAHRLIRRAAAALLMGAASILLPGALEAACITRLVDTSDFGMVQQITCCGDTTCCNTQWQGSTLVRQFCDP